MTRDDFMKNVAAVEINQMYDSKRNRMTCLVERAWAEGKRNAEVETLRNAIDEALAGRDMTQMRHGHWIKLDAHAPIADPDHKCSACQSNVYVPTFKGAPLYRYCPECGAMMERVDVE